MAQSWADHQTKFDAHIAKLPKDHAKAEEFKTEMERLKTEYDGAIPQLPEAHAAQAIAPAVNTLLAKVKAHLPEGTEIIAAPTAPAEDVAADTEAKVDQQADKLAEDAEKKEGEGETLEGAQLTKAKEFVLKKFDITDEALQTKIDKVLATIKFTKEQIKQIELGEKGELKLTSEQTIKIINESTYTGLERPSKEEHELIQTLTEGTKLEEYFDEMSDPAFVRLSQVYRIKKSKEGGVEIEMIDTRNEKKDPNFTGMDLRIANSITSADMLLPYLPDDVGNALSKINEPKEGETAPTEAEMKAMMEGLDTQNQTAEAMMNLREQMIKISEGGDEGEPGFMDAIVMLMKFFQSIQKAFETGDWETLGDFLSDFKDTKDPRELAKRQNDSREAYEKAMENMENQDPKPTLSQLVKGYLKPGEADDLFPVPPGEKKDGVKHPLEKYRAKAKPFIKDYLAKELGGKISIDKIEPGKGNNAEIKAYNQKGNPISIELSFSESGETTGRIINYTKVPNNEGEPIWEPDGSETEFEAVTMDSLKDQLEGTTVDQRAPDKAEGEGEGKGGEQNS
ncbi:hypothetical protein KAR91_00970 [Candidatus Pacearchaeota archaeon]|nr:hypothetical protein [Candidatus Pacearchaeota archaeon]